TPRRVRPMAAAVANRANASSSARYPEADGSDTAAMETGAARGRGTRARDGPPRRTPARLVSPATSPPTAAHARPAGPGSHPAGVLGSGAAGMPVPPRTQGMGLLLEASGMVARGRTRSVTVVAIDG